MKSESKSSDDPAARRFSGFVPKLALSLSALLFVAGISEVFLRVQASFLPAPNFVEQRSFDLAGLQKLNRPRLLKAPNIRGHYAGVPYETNSHGFQGREYAVEKPAGVHRIVILGDSVAMGQGVLSGETFSALAEEALNQAPDDATRFEILNLGIAGYNATHIKDRYRDVGMQFSPDLVIYAFTNNDLDGLPGFVHTRRINKIVDPLWQPKKSASLFVRALYNRWMMVRNVFSPAPHTYIYELDENYFRNAETWQHFIGDVVRMKEMAESTGARFAIFIYMGLEPKQRFFPDGRHYDRVAAAATNLGLPVIRSDAYFERKMTRQSLQVGPLDLHPNAQAHRLIARALVDGLAALPKEMRPPIELDAAQQKLSSAE